VGFVVWRDSGSCRLTLQPELQRGKIGQVPGWKSEPWERPCCDWTGQDGENPRRRGGGEQGRANHQGDRGKGVPQKNRREFKQKTRPQLVRNEGVREGEKGDSKGARRIQRAGTDYGDENSCVNR